MIQYFEIVMRVPNGIRGGAYIPSDPMSIPLTEAIWIHCQTQMFSIQPLHVVYKFWVSIWAIAKVICAPVQPRGGMVVDTRATL